VTVTLRRRREDDAPLVPEATADEYTALIEGFAREGWLERQVENRWSHVIELDGEAVGGVSAVRRRVPGVAEIGCFQREGLLRGYASRGGECRDVFLYGKLEGD
jgi:hypothetical protein